MNKERLEDFIADASVNEYFALLYDKLGAIPRNRAGAKELLSALDTFDQEFSILGLLLSEFRPFLHNGEIMSLINKASSSEDPNLHLCLLNDYKNFLTAEEVQKLSCFCANAGFHLDDLF